jgi:hypothetical protein
MIFLSICILCFVHLYEIFLLDLVTGNNIVWKCVTGNNIVWKCVTGNNIVWKCVTGNNIVWKCFVLLWFFLLSFCLFLFLFLFLFSSVYSGYKHKVTNALPTRRLLWKGVRWLREDEPNTQHTLRVELKWVLRKTLFLLKESIGVLKKKHRIISQRFFYNCHL